MKFGSCVNPCNAIGVRAETTDPGTPVVVVLRHSELRDDHQNLTIGDAAKWAAKKVSNGNARRYDTLGRMRRFSKRFPAAGSSTTPSVRGCHLCLRYGPSPMSGPDIVCDGAQGRSA